MLDEAHPLLRYWRTFKTEFAAFIGAADERALARAWNSPTERTTFYRDNVLPGIARALNLDLRHLVPLIFVESENMAPQPTTRWRSCAPCAPP